MLQLVLHPVDELEAVHVGQAEVEHHAVEAALAQDLQRFFAAADRGDVDVAIAADQLRRSRCAARSLSSMTSSDLFGRSTKPLIFANASSSASFVTGFCTCANAPSRRPRARLVVAGDDVHRDVARRLVVLQAIEHRPPFHVRQRDIERDGVGAIALAPAAAPLSPRVATMPLNPLSCAMSSRMLREGHVVFDDQHDAVARRRSCRGRRAPAPRRRPASRRLRSVLAARAARFERRHRIVAADRRRAETSASARSRASSRCDPRRGAVGAT